MENVQAVDYLPSKTVCERLEISDSTLRKWCLALEKQEYEFTRTEQNRRLFVENDLQVLQYLKDLVQNKKMSLENASIIVASRFIEGRSSTGTPSVRDENTENNAIIEQLNEHIKKQEKFNQELLKRLDEQNEYINQRLDQRDRALTETMNQLLEQRKEEIKLLEQTTEEKDSWFKKIFKKR